MYLRENNVLLVDRVLGMDSLSFREDVAAVAPDFLSSVHLKNSPPHNSLDSTDSNKSSARVQDDTDGLVFARASNGCLWLCKSYFPILSFGLVGFRSGLVITCSPERLLDAIENI